MTFSNTAGYNRLINEKSPYLQQHAGNPVDWYPWGNEAFEKAAAENKPVLVSIGYSTCHWCHVMAEESFSDPETAGVMNREMVNIKIDREERPDLDLIYITAVAALTGSAGWPLNVFLTPEAKPFFGGTYFPAQNRFGMLSWRETVAAVGKAWKDGAERTKLLESADRITEAVKKHLSPQAKPSEQKVPGIQILHEAADSICSAYDPAYGGFSRAPKFPMPPVLDFLLFYHRAFGGTGQAGKSGGRPLQAAVNTMARMAEGGIYDHIGGGFHRYSTDEKWHVPHFEKMLYDNAQLIRVYTRAHEITGDKVFARTAGHCLEYVLRDMTDPQGGFYSAEDADSPETDLSDQEKAPEPGKKTEGAYYVWKKSEIDALLEPFEAEVFCSHYDVRDQGNAETDPFGEFRGKNVLRETRKPAETARHFGLSQQRAAGILRSAEKKLLSARSRRTRPHLDDKIITEWNSLMISALAEAARVFGDKSYFSAAERAAAFINNSLTTPQGDLLRRWHSEEAAIPGLAADYAFFVQALLDIYEAGGSSGYLEQAETLAAAMTKRFYDPESGAFFMTATGVDPRLPFRAADPADGVIPAAGSVACLDFVRLFDLTGDTKFQKAAAGILSGAGQQMRQQPQSAAQILAALGYFHNLNRKGKE